MISIFSSEPFHILADVIVVSLVEGKDLRPYASAQIAVALQ